MKLRLVSCVSLASMAFMLSACGGGGGGVASTPPPPPAVTPPPPPPPPPTPNTSLLSLTSSESFANDAATANAVVNINGPDTSSSAPVTMTVNYDVSNQGYTLNVAGRSITFLPADISAADSNAAVTVYKKTSGATTDSLTLTKPGTSGRFTFQYVGGGYWQRTTTTASTLTANFDVFTYGLPTAATAVPRTGRAEFPVDLVGIQTLTDNIAAVTGSGTMQVDFATGTIVTHGTIGTVLTPPNGSFSSEARLSSSSNAITGNFRFNDFGEFTGQLSGRFYGPTAQEVGATYYATQTDGRVATGTILGRQGSVPAGNTSMTALTRNEFFGSDAGTLRASLAGSSGQNNSGTFSSRSQALSPVIVNYDATERAYTLIASDRSQYFLTADRNRGTIREYLGAPNPNSAFFSSVLPTTQYVLGRRWYTATGVGNSTDYILTDLVFGIQTSNATLPRTGRAGYNIALIGSAADADLPNLTDFGGTGLLTADFATGAVTASGNLNYREDYFIAGRAAATGTGTFSVTSTLSSSSNAFTGTINLTGFGPYTGPLSGKFYGPTAEEVGAAFTASDGSGGAASGILTGIKDPNIFAVVPGFADLTSATLLPNAITGTSSSNNISRESYFQFDPATRTYSFFPVAQPTTNAAALAYRFGPSQLVSAQSDAVFTAYSTTGPAGQFNASDTVSARFFNPGAGNTRLALTHTSFGDYSITQNSGPAPTSRRDFVIFGITTPTAQMPRSGSATFAGLAFGSGQASSGTINLGVEGTSALTANWGTGTFTSSLQLDARNLATNVLTTLAPINFTGTINGSGFSDANFNFIGNFYGQNASEFGAIFFGSGTNATLGLYSVKGAAVGKRN